MTTKKPIMSKNKLHRKVEIEHMDHTN